ncbi:MAG: aminoglycoside phosphotransferase family protein [Chloroflexi bacterium]|nr:aminoglycoside phosphotransferase family protein [Chloroflexota bacterium]
MARRTLMAAIDPVAQHPEAAFDVTAGIPELNELRRFAASTLGSGLKIEDRSRAFGRKSVTWRIEAADGTGFYLKRHESQHHYASEVRAIRDWVTRLPAGSWWEAPEIVASSDEPGAVILTELPGEIIDGSPPSPDVLKSTYVRAGRLARAFHDIDVDLSGESRVQRYGTEEHARYVEAARPHLDPHTFDWVTEVFQRPGLWDGLTIVPMHGDYSPRNWLQHEDDAKIGVIDWERSRPGYWVEDIQRMTHDYWIDTPQLRDAFFEGYGRSPTETEWRQSDQITLINAVGGVPWAISHGDEQFAQHNRRVIERLKGIL